MRLMTLSLGDNKIESRGVKLQSSKSPTLVRGTSLIKRGFARMQKHGVIMDAVTIPIMAKCRIGHVSEARILEATGVDMIDESEVLSPADGERHIWKWEYTTPFVNGAKNLGEALRRIEEGCAMIRTKGEPGTGDVAEAVSQIKFLYNEIRKVRSICDDNQELIRFARELKVS